MSDHLDPELSRALREPARLVRADPALLDIVRDAGAPARQQLHAQATAIDGPTSGPSGNTPGDFSEGTLADSSGPLSTEDRYASAAMLAALFGDRGPLDQAARGYGPVPPRELVALSEVPALRPALKKSLASPVLTGLLEWATKPDPANPPLELAMAARDLGLEDTSVLRSVASRAEQLARQATRRQRGPLTRLAEVLRTATSNATTDNTTTGNATGNLPTDTPPSTTQPGTPNDGPSDGSSPRLAHEPSEHNPKDSVRGDTPPSDPTPTDPTDTPPTPRVTTDGIPASELVHPNEPDPYSSDYPGTGVPVRDSIAGPRPQDPPQNDPPQNDPRGSSGTDSGRGKLFDADRFWPMGPRRQDPNTPDDAARPGSSPTSPTGDSPADDGYGNPQPPREPSTNELYYGVGSDRYTEDATADPADRSRDEKNVVRNWGITFGVIVAVILVLALLI